MRSRPDGRRINPGPQGPGFDHFDARIAALAAAQAGHLARTQLREAGLSDGAIDWRLASGHLERGPLGVLRLAGTPSTLRGHQWAGVLACGPQATLAAGAAAQVEGLLDDEHIDIIVPPHVVRRHPGIRVRRCRLRPEERTVVDGLPVTTWPRTLIDLAALRRPSTVMHAVDRTIQLRMFDAVALDECLRWNPRRAGRARLMRVLALLPDDGSRTASRLESELLHLVLAAGLPRPQVNMPVGPYVADLAWPAARLIVEADGLLWHGGPLAQRRDAERQRALERDGWLVLRFDWGDVLHRGAATVTAIAGALAGRSKRGP